MKRDAKALSDLFNTLDKDRQQSLFDYAEFLQTRLATYSRILVSQLKFHGPKTRLLLEQSSALSKPIL